jgi:hypothetical protein
MIGFDLSLDFVHLAVPTAGSDAVWLAGFPILVTVKQTLATEQLLNILAAYLHCIHLFHWGKGNRTGR